MASKENYDIWGWGETFVNIKLFEFLNKWMCLLVGGEGTTVPYQPLLMVARLQQEISVLQMKHNSQLILYCQ